MTIVYSGHETGLAFVADLAFGRDFRQQYLGKDWAIQWRRQLTSATENVLYFIEGSAALARMQPESNNFYIPMWIEGELDIDEALGRSKKIGNIKEDLRRIRKNQLDYEITCDEHRIEEFHRRMYVPYIKNTFGSTALFHSLNALKESNGFIELLVIKRGDESLAGQILVYENGGVRTREIGVKDGDRQILKAGVMGALYFYGLQHLQRKGFSRVAVGGSRAWLNDGVLRFKKKWGMKLDKPWPTGLLLIAPNASDGVTGFLSNNPFLSVVDNQLEGRYFSDSHGNMSERQVRRIHRDYYYGGMSKLVICPLSNVPWFAEIPDDLADEVVQGHYPWYHDGR